MDGVFRPQLLDQCRVVLVRLGRQRGGRRETRTPYRLKAYLNFFNEHQRGSRRWNREDRIVEVNRTEALDESRAVVREKRVLLPRRAPIVEEFARHMAADAKVLEEDEETGAKRYRYIRTGGGPLLAGLHLRVDGACRPELLVELRVRVVLLSSFPSLSLPLRALAFTKPGSELTWKIRSSPTIATLLNCRRMCYPR
jgi:hypothetical protein